MSRIGKYPVVIPEKTEVDLSTDRLLTVKGPLGSLARVFRTEVSIEVKENEVALAPAKEDQFSRALWGTYASHIRNMIKGVHTPFQKKLIIDGVGFRWAVNADKLTLHVGFSHPVEFQIPEGLKVEIEKNTLTVSGIDKEAVGAFASKVRSTKKPEPYKGKGIRYEDEIIRRKQGKKTA